MALKVTRSGSKAMFAAVRAATKMDVLVGFPSGQPPRDDGSPLSNAAIGYIQEHGDPMLNIPARPFMRPGIEAAREQITAAMRKAAVAAMTQNPEGVKAGMAAAGFAAQASIRNLITDGIAPPLAPATLAERRRAGFRGETPLLRSGELRNGVVWVIAPKGG